MKYCILCATKNESSAKFCKDCGAPFGHAPKQVLSKQLAMSKAQLLMDQQFEEQPTSKKSYNNLQELEFQIQNPNGNCLTLEQIEKGANMIRTEAGTESIAQILAKKEFTEGDDSDV